VLRHDRAGTYRLLRAQSPLGRALYVHYGLDPDDYETNILIAHGRAWFKSEGSIRMAEGLGWPWKAAAVFRIAWLFGFPPAGKDVPVTVAFTARDGREIWRRTFGGRSFSSTQEEGRGRFEGLLCERFGPLAFAMALVLEDGRLRLVVRRWTAFRIPMPLALAPSGNSYESVEDGRFRFHVEIGHRVTGLVVAYRGWLVPRV